MNCALCKKDTKLMKSHLIPKMVYKRVKAHPLSRFRSLGNINMPMQDGEKYTMLCHDCEEKFSALEAYFAKNYFDPYLETGKIPKCYDKKKINDYILSVAWRILWDDMFRMGSKEFLSDEFITFESDLRDYILNDKEGSSDRFENKVYLLSTLVSCPKWLEEGSLFGYAYYPNSHIGCLIIVYYAGLVFVTRYNPPGRIIMCLECKEQTNLKKIIAKEISRQFQEMQKQENKKMTPELKKKIAKRYEK